MCSRISAILSGPISSSRKSQSCRIAAAQLVLPSLCMRSPVGGAGEAEIAGVGEQRVLQQATSAEEPRAHGADGHVENLGRRLVRLVLDIDEDDGGAEGFLQVVQ